MFCRSLRLLPQRKQLFRRPTQNMSLCRELSVELALEALALRTAAKQGLKEQMIGLRIVGTYDWPPAYRVPVPHPELLIFRGPTMQWVPHPPRHRRGWGTEFLGVRCEDHNGKGWATRQPWSRL